MRMNVRKESELPSSRKSTTDNEDPSLAIPYKLKLLPMRAQDLKLMLDPMWNQSNTLRLEPSCTIP
jgi:hypothetical protein